MEKMSGLNRALAAINGEMPDRIPNYTPTVACETASRLLGRTVATGTASMWFAEAKAGVQGAAALEDFEAKIDEDLLDLAEYLQSDVIRKGWRHGRIPTRQLDEYSMLYGDPDGIWERWEFNPAAQSYGMVETNAAPAEPEDWPERARAAIAALPRTVETIRETLGSWEESMQKRVGDRYLVAGTGGSFSCGVDEASLMACLLEPGAVADLLDCQLEIAKASVDAAAARGIRVITGGGDCADNSGLLYSPDFFREVQTPRLTEFSRYCKEKNVHYMWRSDGKLWSISDDLFLTAGIEGYGEVDYLAGMTAGELRARYPELVLWANCAGDTICRGTAEEVYEHAMTVLKGAGRTRHFFGCSNTILAGTPVENVEAMMAAANDFNKDRMS